MRPSSAWSGRAWPHGVRTEHSYRVCAQGEEHHARERQQRAVNVRAQHLVVFARHAQPRQRDPCHSDDCEQSRHKQSHDRGEPCEYAEQDRDHDVNDARGGERSHEGREDTLVLLRIQNVGDPAGDCHLPDALHDQAEREAVRHDRPEHLDAARRAQEWAGQVQQRQGQDRHQPRPRRDQARGNVCTGFREEPLALVEHAAQFETDASHQTLTSMSQYR